MNGTIPPIDLAPDNPLAITTDTPDIPPFPTENPYWQGFLTTEEMSLLIAAFLALLGLNPTVEQLETDAEEYACMAPQFQIPALIWVLINATANVTPANGGRVYSGDYGAAGPTVDPPTPGAIGIDTVTRRQWQYSAGEWT